jgi:hypothetical protein
MIVSYLKELFSPNDFGSWTRVIGFNFIALISTIVATLIMPIFFGLVCGYGLTIAVDLACGLGRPSPLISLIKTKPKARRRK